LLDEGDDVAAASATVSAPVLFQGALAQLGERFIGLTHDTPFKKQMGDTTWFYFFKSSLEKRIILGYVILSVEMQLFALIVYSLVIGCKEVVYTHTGFCNWKNTKVEKRGALPAHEASEAPIIAATKALGFLEIEAGRAKDIQCSLSNAQEDEIK